MGDIADDTKMDGTRFVSILYMLRPLTIIENLFGKFRYRKVGGNIDILNRRMKFYAIFIVCLSVTTFGIIFVNDIKHKTFGSFSKIVNVVDEVASLTMVIQHVLSMAVFLHYTKNNVYIIKLIALIDDNLNISKDKKFYKDSRRLIQIEISIFIFIYTLLAIYDLNAKYTLPNEILITIIDFECHLEVLAFCIFIKTMKDRLCIVNKILEHVIVTKKRGDTLNIPPKSLRNRNDVLYAGCIINDRSIIRNLGITYDLIGEACDEINKVFKFHIFKALCTTFVYIIITIWTSIYYIRTLDTSNSLLRIVLLCLFDIMSVGVMSYTCEVLLLKRNSTKILVNELIINYDLTRQMRLQAKAFMELIEVWPLQIYAYDMFAIDIKLMLKFISVSTTYLIVIFQISHFF
ncbi:uncharacterized protein LOC123870495 [Maniola jurtina]|uniref:uncharacterized protein LOC123870495 n=1 Tax=Maniola jurtina TaxID=191418 RepID=UPI001E689E6F|nr:uncharacterized protein LOC123870495 [Maniola jurtina]